MGGFSVRAWAVLFLAALLLGGGGPVSAHQDHYRAGKDNAATAVEERDKAPRKKRTSRWGADYFPNVTLITHEGKSVRFFDDLLKDKVVILNFMYTSCPDVCPLETVRMVDLQRILGDRVGKDIFMYSITIDPAIDTPEVLKRYMDKLGVGPGWLFLTGDEADILLLRRKMGLYIEGIDDDGDNNNHNVSLVIGNQRTGRWMKRSPFDNPYFLAAQVGSWLGNWRRPADANQNSYATAPRLRLLTLGERLFRTRCTTCHTIGAENIIVQGDQPRLGPDLSGVTQRRERAWLARWLAEPDRMLAEKDPIALELFARYDNLPMPNLSLSKIEVDALIEFMSDESRRVEKTQQNARQ